MPQEFFSKVPMKLTLKGRFHQVVKFFHGVGQQDRIINIENITITDPEVRDDDIYVKVEALATAFRTVEPSTEDESEKDKRGRRKKGGKKAGQ